MITTTTKKRIRLRAVIVSAVIAGLIITAGLGWATGERRDNPPRLFSDVLVPAAVVAEGEVVAAYYSYHPPSAADIGFVGQAGWLVGKPNGDYDPEGMITAAQISNVIGRVFPDGMTRAEFASFLRGGQRRIDDNAENLGLRIADEEPAGYDWDDWERGGWPEAANGDRGLRWEYTGCRWAFYSAQTEPDCMGDNRRDHLVALEEAHQSGGHSWDDITRRRFFLDAENLFVLPSWENRAKGARDPAEWLPARNECEYVRRWLAIKRDWGLSADPTEMAAIARVISVCGDQIGVIVSIPVSTSTTNPSPPSSAPLRQPSTATFDYFRRLTCNGWLAGVGYAGLEGMRRMVITAAAIPGGYDWGDRDENSDGYPCEDQLGRGYIPGRP